MDKYMEIITIQITSIRLTWWSSKGIHYSPGQFFDSHSIEILIKVYTEKEKNN